jgi:hypothetical protein
MRIWKEGQERNVSPDERKQVSALSKKLKLKTWRILRTEKKPESSKVKRNSW